jgi:hypothetical protein
MCRWIKWIWIIVAGICLTTEIEGQVFHLPVKSVYPTGGAYSKRFTDGFSFTGNPAVLGSARQFSMALSTERRWLLKELDLTRMAISCSAGRGGAGLEFQYTGDLAYHEAALALAYGKNLGPIVLGLRFGLDEEQAAGYSRYGSGSAGWGLIFHPLEKLSVGWLLNVAVFATDNGRGTEKTGERYEMGLGYEISDKVFLGVRFQKEAGSLMDISGYLDYCWSQQLYASLGMETSTASPFFKAGWRKNRMTIGLFTAYHPALGFTPGLLLFWEGKNKAE